MPPKTPKPRTRTAGVSKDGLAWTSDRLSTGARAVGTTMVSQAIHLRGGVYFDSPERPYLRDYELALRNDPYLRRIAEFIVLSMVASLGDYTHPNTKCQEFVREMEHTMEGNFEQALSELMYSALWAGFSISEKMFEARKDGLLYLKKLVNYHPASIYPVPGRDGALTDGKNDPSHPFLPKTGIWQKLPTTWLLNPRYQKFMQKSDQGNGAYMNYIRIPKQKVVMLARGARHGNITGESILTPIWSRYEMALETWRNLMITTERYGSPQVLFIVPKASTNTVATTDGSGNPLTYKSLAQVVGENAANLSATQGMVIEEPVNLPNKEQVRAQNISSFNNFGQNFLTIIDHLYRDIFVGMGVPPLMFLEHGQGLSAGAISKVHAETYKQYVTALYKEFVEPFTEQVIGQLLYLNFGETHPGAFAFNPFDLSSAETMMKVFEKAVQFGFLDPSEEEDLQAGRGSLGFNAASPSTMARRLKANKALMEIVRRPDMDKVKIAEIRSKATVFHAETAAEAQVEVAEITTGGQLDSAKLQAKTADKGRAHDMDKHELTIEAQQKTAKVQAQAQVKAAKLAPTPPATPAKPAAAKPKPAPKKAA